MKALLLKLPLQKTKIAIEDFNSISVNLEGMRRKMVRVILCILIFSGCTSMYKTSHELFIDMMSDYVKLGKTISELQAFSGKRIADKEFNVSVEIRARS